MGGWEGGQAREGAGSGRGMELSKVAILPIFPLRILLTHRKMPSVSRPWLPASLRKQVE